jgi:CHAT domain-containing protein
MVEYFVTINALRMWVVDKDGIKFVSNPVTSKDLAAKITKLRDSISRPGEIEQFIEVAQDLYRKLIQPALPSIKGKEPGHRSALHYLPFQALLAPRRSVPDREVSDQLFV